MCCGWHLACACTCCCCCSSHRVQLGSCACRASVVLPIIAATGGGVAKARAGEARAAGETGAAAAETAEAGQAGRAATAAADVAASAAAADWAVAAKAWVAVAMGCIEGEREEGWWG